MSIIKFWCLICTEVITNMKQVWPLLSQSQITISLPCLFFSLRVMVRIVVRMMVGMMVMGSNPFQRKIVSPSVPIVPMSKNHSQEGNTCRNGLTSHCISMIKWIILNDVIKKFYGGGWWWYEAIVVSTQAQTSCILDRDWVERTWETSGVGLDMVWTWVWQYYYYLKINLKPITWFYC